MEIISDALDIQNNGIMCSNFVYKGFTRDKSIDDVKEWRREGMWLLPEGWDEFQKNAILLIFAKVISEITCALTGIKNKYFKYYNDPCSSEAT